MFDVNILLLGEPVQWLMVSSASLRSGKLKVPEWVDTVKLAKHKELAPCDENWFYTRAGKILLRQNSGKVYIVSIGDAPIDRLKIGIGR